MSSFQEISDIFHWVDPQCQTGNNDENNKAILVPSNLGQARNENEKIQVKGTRSVEKKEKQLEDERKSKLTEITSLSHGSGMWIK